MTKKRFNYTCEKIGQHWSIEISDNQTKQPFDVDYSEITDNYSQTKDNVKFIVELLNELSDENEQLKKALCCIRKRYDCSIEEFVEDLKDNGIDLTKVDLE